MPRAGPSLAAAHGVGPAPGGKNSRALRQVVIHAHDISSQFLVDRFFFWADFVGALLFPCGALQPLSPDCTQAGMVDRLNIRIEPELLAAVAAVAAGEGRTVANFVRLVLRERLGCLPGGPRPAGAGVGSETHPAARVG